MSDIQSNIFAYHLYPARVESLAPLFDPASQEGDLNRLMTCCSMCSKS